MYCQMCKDNFDIDGVCDLVSLILSVILLTHLQILWRNCVPLLPVFVNYSIRNFFQKFFKYILIPLLTSKWFCNW